MHSLSLAQAIAFVLASVGTVLDSQRGEAEPFDASSVAVAPAGSGLGAIAGPRAHDATLRLAFHATSLPVGTHTGWEEIEAGDRGPRVVVQSEVAPTNLVRLVADRTRPYLYAVQAPSAGETRHSLLFINTDTEQVERVLQIGFNPTDMTIHSGENRLYITDWGQPQTYVVDLTTQELLPPLALGTDVFKINAGRPGRLYIEGQDQWVQASVIDTSSGAVVGQLPRPVREGDGEISPDGNWYYHADNNISNAHVHKYDVRTDQPVQVAASLEHPSGSRNLVLSADGSRLFWQGYVYDADLNELGRLGEEIYATTLRGELAFSETKVYNTANGQVVYTLPFRTTVLAVSGDQRKVFAYDAAGRRLVSIPMSEIAAVSGPGLSPSPADGATVNLPLSELGWGTQPGALRFEVYLGTEEAAVREAGVGSPEHLGSTPVPRMSLSQALEGGRTYFWRVDVVGFGGVVAGPVWRFVTAAGSVSPGSLSVVGVVGLPLPNQTLTLSSPAAGLPWGLSEEVPWLSVGAVSGSTPAEVEVGFDARGLSAGVYSGTVHVTLDGAVLEVPVRLQLVELALTQMLADRERPYVYGLQRGTGATDDAFLVVFDTRTEQVEKVLPVGANATDFTIHYGERRLYVANWQRNATRVVDLETLELLPPLALGTDVFKINAGRPGRLYIEGQDQWVQASIIDTSSGAVVGQLPLPVREGDGEVSPDGNWYYHADNNISNAHVHKYDLRTDQPVQVAASLEHPSGSRNLVLSADGSRLFWQGYVYDADLNELGRLGEEIYACSANGGFAFGVQRVYATATGQVNYELPFQTTVLAVADAAGKVFAFDPATARLVSLPLAEITNLPPQVVNLEFAGTEDTPLELTLVATDPENDPISFRIVAGPQHGTLSGSPPDLVFTPHRDYFGADLFTYVALDPRRTSAVAQVTLNVTNVNDPPTALNQTLRVPVDGSRQIRLTGADVENSPLTFRVLSPPTHGELSGTPPQVRYRPAAGFSGVDRFSFVANDGELDSPPATVTLNIEAPRCAEAGPGLVAWWRFEEDLQDAASGHVVSSAAPLEYVAGKVGRALRFNGTDAALTVETSSRLRVGGSTTGFTVEGWVWPEGGASPQVLVEWSGSQSPVGLSLALVRDEQMEDAWSMQAVGQPSRGGIALEVFSPPLFTTGGFQHFALVYNPVSGEFILFREGVRIASNTIIAPPAVNTGSVLRVGASSASAPANFFRGALDELSIYDQPLTDTEIEAVVEADVAGRCLTARPPVIVTQPVGRAAEVGATVQFAVEALGAGPLLYQWERDGVPLAGATEARLTVENVTLDNAGAYRVVVRNADGSATSAEAILGINLLRNGSFETGDLSGWTGTDIGRPGLPLRVRRDRFDLGFIFPRVEPTEGRFFLLHGWDGAGPGSISLAQEITLPAAGAVLSFDYRAGWDLFNLGIAFYPRVFQVSIVPASGGTPVATYPILIAEPGTILNDTGPSTQRIDLTPFGGQSVRLVFSWTVPQTFSGLAFFELDNVALVARYRPPLRLPPGALSRAELGGMRLRFSAVSATTYTVQASDDLVHWTALGTATDRGGGQFEFLDATAVSTPRRFYRITAP